MPTLVVGMRIAEKSHNMPTASVGMAPFNSELTKHSSTRYPEPVW
jgi:hypothetical protein